jgi:ABC-2 type transport system ATP-binding protein
MIGPRREGGHGLPPSVVIEARATGRQETVLARAGGWDGAVGWDLHHPTLEELAMAYLRTASPSRSTNTREVAVA